MLSSGGVAEKVDKLDLKSDQVKLLKNIKIVGKFGNSCDLTLISFDKTVFKTFFSIYKQTL